MNSEIIWEEFSKRKFVDDTLLQIQKDFNRCGWDIHFDFLNDFNIKTAIEDRISEILSEVMKHSESQLLQLIYIIDIPEKEFLALFREENVIEKLAEKILWKEAYKVYLRRKFS